MSGARRKSGVGEGVPLFTVTVRRMPCTFAQHGTMKQQLAIIIVIAVVLVLSCNSSGQTLILTAQYTPTVPHIVPTVVAEPVFQLAAPSDQDFPQYYTLVFDRRVIVVTWNDNALDFPQESQREILNLTTEKSFLIDKLWYTRFGEDLIIVYSITNFDVGKSYMARINMPKKSPTWNTAVGAFNLGEPVIRGQYIYVTAIGLVAKLDSGTGKYVWRHDGLYDRQTQDFNDFQKPVLDGERVVFQGNNHFSDIAKRIEVKDSTGEIIGIFTTDQPSSSKPMPTAPIPPAACSATHLGTGKNLAVNLHKGCYYHFELPCGECQAGEKNIIAIHYTGDEFSVVVPEGSAWQHNESSSLSQSLCRETHIRDHWPNKLPWFLILPGVEQLAPCG